MEEDIEIQIDEIIETQIEELKEKKHKKRKLNTNMEI